MQVKSTAECSPGAFCNTVDPHEAIIGLETLFFLSLSDRLRQQLLFKLAKARQGLTRLAIRACCMVNGSSSLGTIGVKSKDIWRLKDDGLIK